MLKRLDGPSHIRNGSRKALIKRPKNGPLKLDLGCGHRKKDGYIGIDLIKFPGVDYVLDLTERWPLADGTVDEVHSSHFIEHLGPQHRCFFFNELWRVLAEDGTASIVVPHWSTCRAYGDPSHQWPPIGEFLWYYLERKWRLEEAPHTDKQYVSWGYDCDFHTTWGYGLAQTILSRSQDYQNYAVNHLRESVYDIHATLTKRKAVNDDGISK